MVFVWGEIAEVFRGVKQNVGVFFELEAEFLDFFGDRCGFFPAYSAVA